MYVTNLFYMFTSFCCSYNLLLQAILAFLTANEDLKERLGPKVEELRQDVDKLKGTACII